MTASSSPPDFAAQAKDPAYGAPLPEGKLYEGPRRLHFEGYREDKAGTPTFRYQVNADEPHPAEVSERPEPLRRPVAVGVARHFMLDLPAQRTAWLWAGEANATPRLLDPARNNIATLDDQQPTTELPAEDRLLVLPQGGGRAVVLAVPTAPPGTRWCLRRQDGRWQALLCLPTTSRPARVAVRLDVWVPYRDDPELLKDFLSRK